MLTPRIAVAPGSPSAAVRRVIEEAGAELCDLTEADGLLWLDWRDTDALKASVDAAPSLRWVQLPWAGVEHYAEAGVLRPDLIWTCAKGVYGPEVAEHALALALSLLRSLKTRSRASAWEPSAAAGPRTLYGARVTILGAGGIAQALLAQLAPFEVEATVVRREPQPLAGAARTVRLSDLGEVLPGSLVCFVTLALTPETEHVIGRKELDALGPDGFLVNVARGGHVVTADLVEALRAGSLGGAALDVTDPEPLPDGHELWAFDNCLITPHVANPAVGETNDRLLDLFGRNLRLFAFGHRLEGIVDPQLGY